MDVHRDLIPDVKAPVIAATERLVQLLDSGIGVGDTCAKALAALAFEAATGGENVFAVKACRAPRTARLRCGGGRDGWRRPACPSCPPSRNWLKDRRRRKSRVAILSATDYAENLPDVLFRGLRLFRLDVKGRSVQLKPNPVEHIAGVEVNTNALLVGAAIDAFLRLGAARVIVAEGPAHQRDTYLVLVESGLDEQLRLRQVQFVDLNRDAVLRVPTNSDHSGLGHLWLPRTLVSTDVVVSMPKVKTHHSADVTLSMKNMFGVVPGVAYGWPKNVRHWRGIHESILGICSTVPIHFVIADGIVAMEGNGPLHGVHRQLGKMVLADDPVAADFICCSLMGLRPDGVAHLVTTAHWLGNIDVSRIEQLGEPLPARVRPFAVLPESSGLVDI